MRLSLGMMFQNFSDWDRFLALERGEDDVGEPTVPDWKAWKDHLDVFLQADELGFDALWSVEHHFTPYCLIPDPLQLLTYIAGATKRIDVGSMVCVLPWWEPLKLAEEVEHAADGPRRRAQPAHRRRPWPGPPRVRLARHRHGRVPLAASTRSCRSSSWRCTNERFSFDGEHFHIPPTSIRPYPKDGAGPRRPHLRRMGQPAVDPRRRRGRHQAVPQPAEAARRLRQGPHRVPADPRGAGGPAARAADDRAVRLLRRDAGAGRRRRHPLLG